MIVMHEIESKFIFERIYIYQTCLQLSCAVGFSLSVNESVCEGAGSVTACVRLESDIETDAVAFVRTFDGKFAKGMYMKTRALKVLNPRRVAND